MKKLFFIILLLSFPFCSFSQTEKEKDDPNQNQENSWNFDLAPYFFMASLNGDISFLSQTLPVDARFSDLLKDLSFGAMFHGEANAGDWTIITDLIYIKLKKDGELLNGHITTKAELEEIIFELGGGYSFYRTENFKIDAIAGARFFSLNTVLKATFQQDRILDKSINFVDPYIGVRYKTQYKKWKNSARIDIGGFGIGSEFSWKFNVVFGYDVSKTIALALGYQGFGVDYRKNKNSFKYDIFTGGPLFGVNFHF